jgi:hypothetical protein
MDPGLTISIIAILIALVIAWRELFGISAAGRGQRCSIAVGGPNQLVSASVSPRSDPSPTQAT